MISNAGSANPLDPDFATGGDSPTTGFAGDFSGNGLTDLVVGNNGDGNLALLLGGSEGLSLSQSLSNPAAPNPTAVSFGGVTDGVLSFYVSTAGHDAALEMAFDLSSSAAIIGPGTAPSLGLSAVPGATIFEVARLDDLNGSAFDLLATLVTLTILPENLESELESGGGGALLASFSPGGSVGLGQGLGLSRSNDGTGSGEPEVANPANRIRPVPAVPARPAPLWIGWPHGHSSPSGWTRRGEASRTAGPRRRREWPSDRVEPAARPGPGSSQPRPSGRSVAVRDETPLQLARRDQVFPPGQEPGAHRCSDERALET